MSSKKPVLFVVALALVFYYGPAFAADSAAGSNDRAQQAFRKGKNLYDQRRYAEAFREWDAALPDLEGQPIKKTIDFLKSRVKDVVVESTQAPPAPVVQTSEPLPTPEKAKEVSAAAAVVPPTPVIEPPAQIAAARSVETPAGFKETLLDAEKTAVKENRAATEERVRAQKETKQALKIQKEIDAAFVSGKKHYENGKISEALKEWEKILPHLKDPESFKRRMESLRRRSRHLIALKLLKQKTPKKKSPALTTDADITARMQTLLEESNQRLITSAKKEIESRKSRQEIEERAKLEENERLEKDFESGKAFLAKGDLDRAAAAWEKALPSTESKKAIKAKLEELKETQRRLKKISEISEKTTIQASPAAGTQEHQMDELLKNANARLKDEIKELEAKRADKKNLPNTPIAPETRMRKVEIETQPVPGDPRAMVFQETAAGPLEDHEFYLEKKLPSPSVRKKEAKKREALELQQAAERKKAWVHSTFEEGRVMYRAGHPREAFLLWDTLTPYLAKEPDIKSYIKKATAAVTTTSRRV